MPSGGKALISFYFIAALYPLDLSFCKIATWEHPGAARPFNPRKGPPAP